MSVIQIIIISAAIILCTLIIGFLFPLFDSIKEKLNDRNINTNDCEIFYEAIRLRRAWKSISQRWLNRNGFQRAIQQSNIISISI